jgi:hypothetical protein
VSEQFHGVSLAALGRESIRVFSYKWTVILYMHLVMIDTDIKINNIYPILFSCLMAWTGKRQPRPPARSITLANRQKVGAARHMAAGGGGRRMRQVF